MIRTPQIEHPLSLPSSRIQTRHNPLPTWKRTLDLLCLAALAPAAVPLMGLAALVIRLFSSGPVLFRQQRIGLYGQPFICLKFRTMHLANDKTAHEEHLAQLLTTDRPMTKLDLIDERIIPFGMLLRATGLDELPQLLNILRGEMSLVGPRPCLPYEHKRFQPQHSERFNAVPGLTGLWQVSGKNHTTFREMIQLDVDYARNLSLRRDLRILLLTFPVLFSQTAVVIRNKWQRVRKSRCRS